MDESQARLLGREMMRAAARAAKDAAPPQARRVEARVVSVSGGTMTLDMGDADHPMRFQARMTTACSSAKAGDTALVDVVGHVATAIGVLV